MYKVIAPFALIRIIYRWALFATNEQRACSEPKLCNGNWEIIFTGVKPQISAEFFFIFGCRLVRDYAVIINELGEFVKYEPYKCDEPC